MASLRKGVPSGRKGGSIMQKKDPATITRDFHARQTRQILAIAAALFLVLLAAVVYKRPDLFGAFPKGLLFGIQALLIAGFIGFSAVNWRCPSCSKFLGNDVHQDVCRKCGARLR